MANQASNFSTTTELRELILDNARTMQPLLHAPPAISNPTFTVDIMRTNGVVTYKAPPCATPKDALEALFDTTCEALYDLRQRVHPLGDHEVRTILSTGGLYWRFSTRHNGGAGGGGANEAGGPGGNDRAGPANDDGGVGGAHGGGGS